MTEIITAVYASKETVANVYDELVSTGIPREKIKIDADKHQVQVMTPDVSDPEVTEVLRRHQPIEIRS